MNFALTLIGLVISIVFMPRPQSQAAPKPTSDDIEVPTAEEGKPMPVAFGTPTIKAPNCVWWGDLYLKAIKAKGGKK